MNMCNNYGAGAAELRIMQIHNINVREITFQWHVLYKTDFHKKCKSIDVIVQEVTYKLSIV